MDASMAESGVNMRRVLADLGLENVCCVSIGLVLGGAMLMVCGYEVFQRVISNL